MTDTTPAPPRCAALSHEPVIPRKKKDRGTERRYGQAPANVRVNLPGYVKYGLVINPGVTVPNGA